MYLIHFTDLQEASTKESSEIGMLDGNIKFNKLLVLLFNVYLLSNDITYIFSSMIAILHI